MLVKRALARWRPAPVGGQLAGTLLRQRWPAPQLLVRKALSSSVRGRAGFTALGFGGVVAGTVCGAIMSCDSAQGSWAAHTDPATGRTYYYNSQTGETAWEKPKPLPPPLPPPPAPPPPQSTLSPNQIKEVSEALQVAAAEMRTALGGLKLSELRQRAVAAGVPQGQLDNVDDAESPKQAVIDLIVTAGTLTMEAEATARVRAATQARAAAEKAAAEAKLVAQVVGTKMAALREELPKLKLSQLRKKARASGVPDEQLDDAEDGESPRKDITALILKRAELQANSTAKAELQAKAAAAQAAAAAARKRAEAEAERVAARQAAEAQAAKTAAAKAALEAPLRDELSSMKMSALKRRARVAGVTPEQLEEAEDAEDAKQALTELIVAICGPIFLVWTLANL